METAGADGGGVWKSDLSAAPQPTYERGDGVAGVASLRLCRTPRLPRFPAVRSPFSTTRRCAGRRRVAATGSSAVLGTTRPRHEQVIVPPDLLTGQARARMKGSYHGLGRGGGPR